MLAVSFGISFVLTWFVWKEEEEEGTDRKESREPELTDETESGAEIDKL